VRGLRDRLRSHASGRRSGDQFCIYVADRLVLSVLTSEERTAIGSGVRSFDALVRAYIHEHLAYRFVVFRHLRDKNKEQSGGPSSPAPLPGTRQPP